MLKELEAAMSGLKNIEPLLKQLEAQNVEVKRMFSLYNEAIHISLDSLAMIATKGPESVLDDKFIAKQSIEKIKQICRRISVEGGSGGK